MTLSDRKSTNYWFVPEKWRTTLKIISIIPSRRPIFEFFIIWIRDMSKKVTINMTGKIFLSDTVKRLDEISKSHCDEYFHRVEVAVESKHLQAEQRSLRNYPDTARSNNFHRPNEFRKQIQRGKKLLTRIKCSKRRQFSNGKRIHLWTSVQVKWTASHETIGISCWFAWITFWSHDGVYSSKQRQRLMSSQCKNTPVQKTRWSLLNCCNRFVKS